jgi:hypothetical protein
LHMLVSLLTRLPVGMRSTRAQEGSRKALASMLRDLHRVGNMSDIDAAETFVCADRGYNQSLSVVLELARVFNVVGTSMKSANPFEVTKEGQLQAGDHSGGGVVAKGDNVVLTTGPRSATFMKTPVKPTKSGRGGRLDLYAVASKGTGESVGVVISNKQSYGPQFWSLTTNLQSGAQKQEAYRRKCIARIRGSGGALNPTPWQWGGKTWGCEQLIEGQSANRLWFVMRWGLVTASSAMKFLELGRKFSLIVDEGLLDLLKFQRSASQVHVAQDYDWWKAASVDDMQTKNKPQMQAVCKAFGLPTSGNKPILAKRIFDLLADDDAPQADTSDDLALSTQEKDIFLAKVRMAASFRIRACCLTHQALGIWFMRPLKNKFLKLGLLLEKPAIDTLNAFLARNKSAKRQFKIPEATAVGLMRSMSDRGPLFQLMAASPDQIVKLTRTKSSNGEVNSYLAGIEVKSKLTQVSPISPHFTPIVNVAGNNCERERSCPQTDEVSDLRVSRRGELNEARNVP